MVISHEDKELFIELIWYYIGSFLSEIKPQADGANGIRYNLTPDITESIFKTYPAVKKKHMENVPSKLRLTFIILYLTENFIFSI